MLCRLGIRCDKQCFFIKAYLSAKKTKSLRTRQLHKIHYVFMAKTRDGRREREIQRGNLQTG